MSNTISYILDFIIEAFLQSWPYLLVTIPVAVAVQLSGASRYIRRAFMAQPAAAIVLATLVGAFSPFCSCSVIPLVAALLIGGVPLAPVMAFWIASPSMDPEIFFLSVAMLGWELAAARLLATLALSVTAGFITQWLMSRGWLGEEILRSKKPPRVLKTGDLLRSGWRSLQEKVSSLGRSAPASLSLAQEAACCSAQGALARGIPAIAPGSVMLQIVTPATESTPVPRLAALPAAPEPFWRRLGRETAQATLLVVQFMALAFLLEALIQLYVPESWVAGLVGRQSPFAILTAALLGVPVYTSNLTALPMVSGLLAQGMSPAAALAFLIAGPTTTLPAMSAVWGLVNRRVFALYVAFALAGAVVMGYVYQVYMSF